MTLDEALDEAILHMEELVEGHERIKRIKAVTLEECKCAAEHRQIAEWLKDYKQLKEQEPKWISVSERLPEEREWAGTKLFGTTISDEVYVTLETPDGERFTRHLSFQNGRLSRTDQERIP